MARLACILVLGLPMILSVCEVAKPPVRVGILHSKSGTMAKNESPLIYVALLVIETNNTSRGTRERLIEPIAFNSNSSPRLAHEGAVKLIDAEDILL